MLHNNQSRGANLTTQSCQDGEVLVYVQRAKLLPESSRINFNY
jgi:hypothetical protein